MALRNYVDNKACTMKDGPTCSDWTRLNPWRAPGIQLQ